MMNLKPLALTLATLAAFPAFAQRFGGGFDGRGDDHRDRSNEQLVSVQVNRQVFGQGNILDLNQLLNLGIYNGSQVNSVVVIASTRDGRGQMDLLVNGVASSIPQNVGDKLQSIQLPLNGALGQNIMSLQLRTSGMITIALAGVTLEQRQMPQPAPNPYPNPQPAPNPYPAPGPGPGPAPAPRASLSFRGRLGDSLVSFSGNSVASIYNDCQNYTRNGRVTMIDKVSAFDVEATTSGWIQNDSICAFVALNVRQDNFGPAVPVAMEGRLVTIPFRIENGYAESVDTIINTYLPIYMKSVTMIDKITMNGQTYTTSGWWQVQSVQTLLKYNQRVRRGYLVADGIIESSPFFFSGNSTNEIRTQCLDYLSGMRGTMTMYDNLTVNGSSQTTSGWWTADQACMTISALAK